MTRFDIRLLTIGAVIGMLAGLLLGLTLASAQYSRAWAELRCIHFSPLTGVCVLWENVEERARFN